MTPDEIMTELESLGERNIIFEKGGVIVSFHGKATINYWIVENESLICFDSKTVDS